jgi:hypothetical protein
MIFINVLVRLNQIGSFREKLFVKLLIYLLLFLIGRILCENIFLQCPQSWISDQHKNSDEKLKIPHVIVVKKADLLSWNL